MLVALAINLALLAAEVVGGILTGSLALLADAGHLLSDAGAIGLALGAAALAARPGSSRRTFGYQRTEVLAAFANGVTLVVVAVLVAIAAIGRLGDPPESTAAGVLVLGAARAGREPGGDGRSGGRGARATSTSRGCCATASPTRSARSASSSPER